MRPRFSLVLPSILLALVALLPPAAVLAAPPADPKQIARALADEGYALYEAGKYDEAIEAFRKAEGTFHAPTLIFALAKAHAKKGKLVEARDLFQRVADEKLPPSAPEQFRGAQESAREEIAALDKRIPTLVVSVQGAAGRSLRVAVDDIDVPAASLDRPVPRNPGDHVVVAVPRGGIGVSHAIVLEEGAQQRVEIELSASGTDVAIRRSTPAPPLAQPTPAAAPRRWLTPAIVSFGASGAALAVGIATGVVAAGRSSAIAGECSATFHCPARVASDLSSAKGIADVSTASFVLAGIGAATGVVLLVVRPSGKARPAVGVAAGPGSVTLQGVF